MGSEIKMVLTDQDSEVEVLKQQLQDCQKRFALALVQKEDLAQTCDSQATRIANMMSRLEEIQDWKAQAKQQLEQLYVLQSTDSDLLFKNELFIEQFQGLQALNRQLQVDKGKLTNALELANAKINKLENAAGTHPENPEHAEDDYLSILENIDELHSQILAEQEEKQDLQAKLSSSQENLAQNEKDRRQLQCSLTETESLLAEQQNLTLQAQEKLEALKTEFEAQVQELQQRLSTLHEKLQLKSQALEIAAETHKQMQDDLDQKNVRFEKECTELQNEIQSLRTELEENTHCAEEFSLLIQEVNAENEELRQNIEQTTQQVTQIQNRIVKQQKENEELRKGNIALQESAALLAEAQEERETAQQRVRSLEQSLMQERAVLNVTQQEVQKYHKMTSDLQDKICKMSAEAQALRDAELKARPDSATTPSYSVTEAGFLRTQSSIQQLREGLELRKQQKEQTGQQLSCANAELNLIQKG